MTTMVMVRRATESTMMATARRATHEDDDDDDDDDDNDNDNDNDDDDEGNRATKG